VVVDDSLLTFIGFGLRVGFGFVVVVVGLDCGLEFDD